MDKQTLVIFAKRPQVGHGKQRLAADIGPVPAFEIAQEMFQCALDDAKEWQKHGPVVLAVESTHDINWAMQLGFEFHLIIPQIGENLGHRINFIDHSLRHVGHKQIFYIGTDAPTLDTEFFDKARQMLNDNDFVFGPAEDGGVTLMAGKHSWPKLDLLDWSTDKVSDQLQAVCKGNNYSIGMLPFTYDVDVLADLEKLVRDLANDHRPNRKKLHDLVEAELDTLEFY